MCVVYVAEWGWFVGCLVWCGFGVYEELEAGWGWGEVGSVRYMCDVYVLLCVMLGGLSRWCTLSYVLGDGSSMRVGLWYCGM